ncbi:putative Insoluble matrix shell protein 1 [Paratrimastix pyriformis]|uniref:Insoluble matrix shell protein 1 n=1 Tax=Paratrimastix pyriformis TaxID=342808 RepID=A0ABQ8UFJ8_9EUKA|nr:putative Insoluble matrix shell protein 1 [Paratrimastix pyriformis]
MELSQPGMVVTGLSAGKHHCAAITAKGEVYTWGANECGQLGQGNVADSPHPHLVETLVGRVVKQIACGSTFTAALSDGGELYVWGHLATLRMTTPGVVDLGHRRGAQVACGGGQLCVLTTDGDVLVLNDSSHEITFEVQAALQPFRVLSLCCGPDTSGVLIAAAAPAAAPPPLGFLWGLVAQGSERVVTMATTPVQLPVTPAELGGNRAARMAIGQDFVVAALEKGGLLAWGAGGEGQLARGDTHDSVAAQSIEALANTIVVSLGAGTAHCAACDTLGRLWTWGRGVDGQLGHGNFSGLRAGLNNPANIPRLPPRLPPPPCPDMPLDMEISAGCPACPHHLDMRKCGGLTAPRAVGFFEGRRVTRVACGAALTLCLVEGPPAEAHKDALGFMVFTHATRVRVPASRALALRRKLEGFRSATNPDGTPAPAGDKGGARGEVTEEVESHTQALRRLETFLAKRVVEYHSLYIVTLPDQPRVVVERTMFKGLLLLCLAAAALGAHTHHVHVTLNVFTGERDPSWSVKNPSAELIEMLQQNAEPEYRPWPWYRMGYRGFEVLIDGAKTVVYGNKALEHALFATAPAGLLKDTIVDHAHQHIVSRPLTAPRRDHVLQTSVTRRVGDQCTIPVVGPDNETAFDLAHDDCGFFVSHCSSNNCYAYGSDIVTDTFPQPGRGSGKKWDHNTCVDIRASAERDGLKWAGTTLPVDDLPVGHYVSLHIWPNTNFHWVRKDTNLATHWSHKPGGTPVREVDNNGHKITDPSKADLSPWSEFCGYMIVVPSNVTLN